MKFGNAKKLAQAKEELKKAPRFKEDAVVDIYHTETEIQHALDTAKREMSEANYQLLHKYFILVSGIHAPISVRNQLRTISRIARINEQKDFASMNKDDVDIFLYHLRKKYPKKTEKRTDNTYQNHIKDFKLFMRWVYTGYRNWRDLQKLNMAEPVPIAHVYVPQSTPSISRTELITKQEINLMLNTTHNLQDRALIAMFGELGTRSAEGLTRNRKHLKFLENKAILLAAGKTGMRDLEIHQNVKILFDWFNVNKGADGEVPLFILEGVAKYGKRMTYEHAMLVLKKSAKKAGITKRVTFQLLRHSAATHNAGFLPDSAMKEFFGWTPDSNVHTRYNHWNGSDTSRAFAKHYGNLEHDELDETLIKCRICNHPNNPTDKKCEQCMAILSAEEAHVVSIKEAEDNEEMKEMMQYFRRLKAKDKSQ